MQFGLVGDQGDLLDRNEKVRVSQLQFPARAVPNDGSRSKWRSGFTLTLECFCDRGNNFIQRERFGDDVVYQNVQVMGTAALFGITRHHQYPKLGMVARHIERELNSVHNGHGNIGQKQIVRLTGEGLQCQGTIRDRGYLMAVVGKRAADKAAHRLVVFR